MPSFPEGTAWPPPADVWEGALERSLSRPASAYVHIPFCTVRCGYCDFNTYTNEFGPGADLSSYAESVLAEISLSADLLAGSVSPLRSVFFGGGTPTLLQASALGGILAALRDTFGFAPEVEVTVEANPETLSPEYIRELAEMGVNRLSVGMQSAVPQVLAVLDRQHRPEKIPHVLGWAKDAGLQVSLDLIYGAPTETIAQWVESLTQAVSLEPDHVSAYSLIVEQGTKLAGQIGRGEVASPDEDESAEKYILTEQMLSEAGYRWYEISNFAKAGIGNVGVPAAQLPTASKHNLAYWRDWNWWGYGPGAHSHWGNLRWWNVKHPQAYAGRVSGGAQPGFQGEVLDSQTRAVERLMLGIRTAEGVPLTADLQGVERLLEENLISAQSLRAGRITVTLRGRLMADYVTRVLLGWEN